MTSHNRRVSFQGSIILLFLLVTLVLMLLVFVVVSYYLPSLKSKDQQNLMQSTNLVISEAPSLKVSVKLTGIVPTPELPKLTWNSEQRVESQSASDYLLFVTDKKTDRYLETVHLAGTLSTVKLSVSEYSSTQTQIEAFQQELIKKGWIDQKYRGDNGIELSPVQADGPMGESVGFLNVDSGMVREIIITSLHRENTYEREIFVSDEYAIDEIIEK